MAKGGLNSGMNWNEQAQRLQKEAHVFYFVFKHRRTRWYIRWIAACAVAYLFSPVQLIPSFIPVIGLLDDWFVLFAGAKVIRRFTPPDVLRECYELADAAEARRKEEVSSRIFRFAVLLTAASWLLAAVVASALLAAYLYR